MLSYSYNKTANLLGHGNPIQRFVWPPLARRIAAYLCRIRPVEWAMVSPESKEDFKVLLFPGWTDQKARSSFEKLCHQIGIPVSTQPFRHIAEALIRKNIKNSGPAWMEAIDDMAGHGNSAAALYGNDTARRKNNPEDSERIFYEISCQWQALITK